MNTDWKIARLRRVINRHRCSSALSVAQPLWLCTTNLENPRGLRRFFPKALIQLLKSVNRKGAKTQRDRVLPIFAPLRLCGESFSTPAPMCVVLVAALPRYESVALCLYGSRLTVSFHAN